MCLHVDAIFILLVCVCKFFLLVNACNYKTSNYILVLEDSRRT